ncbi:MAG TPA: mucoidy inhibitor MuiA family protein [Ktedonobacteraceae bacterium]|nr:mucoidy inhibitor MuiA family protein [Ktedonobacteraceae bacterium]
MADLVAPIKEVTVYADRALVTRAGQISLSAGEHELRINNLPTFIRESLRASGQGPQGTRILNVDITTTYHSRPPESEIQTLQTACDLLQRRIDLLQAQQAALNDRSKWLRALGEQSHDFVRGLARGQMKPQDCADFFSFAATQALQNAEAAQELDIQLKQVREELAAKQREVARKQGHGLPDRLAAVVSIEMPTDGDFSLELSYLVMQASWRPQYDVRVAMDEDGNRGRVELSYIGMVQQSTGENWDQVSLALSTARPSQAAVLPELEPRYLRVYTPLPPIMLSAPAPMAVGAASRARMSAAPGKSAELADLDSYADSLAIPPPPVQAEVATASVEQTGTAYVFRIARSVDIPSDNSPHKTTIARDELPCEFDYVSAPGVESNVHLRAKITNATERVLLPGESSIFLSGEYVGTTKVKMTAPKEQFKIFLGLDDTIKVKREQLERSVEKGALLQSDLRRIIYAYRIVVHNYAAFTRNIVLRDQLPVSQHERVKVKTVAIQPPPTERTKLEIVTWRFPLAADGEQKFEYRFTVEHPQDVQVSGLP